MTSPGCQGFRLKTKCLCSDLFTIAVNILVGKDIGVCCGRGNVFLKVPVSQICHDDASFPDEKRVQKTNTAGVSNDLLDVKICPCCAEFVTREDDTL